MDFKKQIFIVFFCIGISSFAQNQLEFNQVITYDTTFSNVPVSSVNQIIMNSEILTVPVNKVWKIEYLKIDDYLKYSINDVLIESFFATHSGSGVSMTPIINNKIWLKSGDQFYARYQWSCNNCSPMTRSVFFSIIEFNVLY